jgi:hypothetical protein
MRKFTLITALVVLVATLAFGQALNNYLMGDEYVAAPYGNYTMKTTGTVAAGTATMTVALNGVTDPNGTCFVETTGFGSKKFTPLFVNNKVTILDANSETVTITAASSALLAHAASPARSRTRTTRARPVVSGSFGLNEALNDAATHGGGVVVVGPNFKGASSDISAATVLYPNVSIRDSRGGATQYWYLGQTATTALATPTTLTAVTALTSATPVGAFGTGTYHYCISYVDLMGNEGTCSADFSQAGLATSSMIFTAPAASPGAVGYTIYISLTGGTYALSYKVPITSSVCTLTTVETITAACAVANTNYGQAGATATVSAITVNTAMIEPNATTISATTQYISNPNARTTYGYVPSSTPPVAGVIKASLPFPVGVAAGSTVPDVIGTLTLPAGFMNIVGRTIEVCGYATEASAGSTATISDIQVWWNAAGSNAAGVPVLIGTKPMTNTLVTAKTDQFYFCYDFKTTVAGAGVTAGSILQTGGNYCNQYTSSSVATVPLCVLGQGPAAVASLNLAGEARMDFVWLHTTGTDGAGVQLQDLTVKVLN